MDSRNLPDANRIWRAELEHWQETTRGFMNETLLDLRDVVHTIEQAVQEESKAAEERSNAAPQELAPTPVVVATKPSNGGALPERSEPSFSDRSPSVVESGRPGTTSDHRLAQLARRLEEKLGKSNTQTAADTR